MTAMPPPVEDCRRRIEQLTIDIDILDRENLRGGRSPGRNSTS